MLSVKGYAAILVASFSVGKLTICSCGQKSKTQHYVDIGVGETHVDVGRQTTNLACAIAWFRFELQPGSWSC